MEHCCSQIGKEHLCDNNSGVGQSVYVSESVKKIYGCRRGQNTFSLTIARLSLPLASGLEVNSSGAGLSTYRERPSFFSMEKNVCKEDPNQR